MASFPHVEGRDLLGHVRPLPDAFAGDRNVVIVAFDRRHQRAVDSWVPWLTAQATHDPALRFYEIPTISRRWAPLRPLIDGGMTAAIGDPVVLERTITVYGDRRRITEPLGINDLTTIWLFVVDRAGNVRWTGRGPYSDALGRELADALGGIG